MKELIVNFPSVKETLSEENELQLKNGGFIF